MLKRVLPIVAIVLAANGAALGLAARNRGGAADSSLTVTERELRVTGTRADTTGMMLTFEWNRGADMAWFDRAKLTSLGFDCSMPADAVGAFEHYSGPWMLSRAVYVVFEYDPDRPVRKEDDFISRLRPVDVGLDPSALRARHTDRSRYLITAATVRPTLDGPSAGGPPRLRGLVLWVDPIHVYVPQQVQAAIAGSPHYRVRVEYGSRFLPRIVSAVGGR